MLMPTFRDQKNGTVKWQKANLRVTNPGIMCWSISRTPQLMWQNKTLKKNLLPNLSGTLLWVSTSTVSKKAVTRLISAERVVRKFNSITLIYVFSGGFEGELLAV